MLPRLPQTHNTLVPPPRDSIIGLRMITGAALLAALQVAYVNLTGFVDYAPPLPPGVHSIVEACFPRAKSNTTAANASSEGAEGEDGDATAGLEGAVPPPPISGDADPSGLSDLPGKVSIDCLSVFLSANTLVAVSRFHLRSLLLAG